MEDLNLKRWFAIPYKAMSWRTKCINLKKIAQKSKTLECRTQKRTKKADMTSSNQNFKNLRKCHLKFLLMLCGPNFIEIGQEFWKWEAVTDRHRQTDRQTDPQTDLSGGRCGPGGVHGGVGASGPASRRTAGRWTWWRSPPRAARNALFLQSHTVVKHNILNSFFFLQSH